MTRTRAVKALKPGDIVIGPPVGNHHPALVVLVSIDIPGDLMRVGFRFDGTLDGGPQTSSYFHPDELVEVLE